MLKNNKWLVVVAAAVAALVMAACAPAEPETIVETVVVETEGETVVETVVVEQEVEVPAEGEGEEMEEGMAEIPFELNEDAVYSVGIFSDITTTNFFGANGPDNTVWNSYVLPPQIAAYGLTEKTFQFVPGVGATPVDEVANFTEEDRDGETVYTIDIAIEEGITWSDGEPVTAEDWAYTAQVVKDLGLIAGNFQSWYDFNLLDTIEVVDEYTARLVYLTEPGLARHQYGVLQAPWVAEHYWAPLTDPIVADLEGLEGDELTAAQTEAQDEVFAIAPEGEPVAGPWIFEVWEPGAFAENSRNADYYSAGVTAQYYEDGYAEELEGEVIVEVGDASGEPELTVQVGPLVGSAVYSIYGSQDAALLALRDGEIDFILNPLGLQRGLLDQVEGDEAISVIENSVNGFRYLSFNVREAPMSEVSFRQAVATIIDKEFVTGTILQGVAFPLYSFVPEGNAAWYFDDVPRWGFSEDGTPLTSEERLAEAVRILEEGGFTWDGDTPVWDPDNNAAAQGVGRLVNPDGTPVEDLELLAPSPGYDPLRSTFAIWVESWLQDLGVPVTANLTGFNVIVQKVFVEQDFDMQILGWSLGIFPDYLYDFFAEEQAALNGNNAGGYVNPEFEELGQQLLTCQTVDECTEIANQMQLILATDVPYVVLFDTGIIETYRNESVRFPYTETLSGLQFGGHSVSDNVAVR